MTIFSDSLDHFGSLKICCASAELKSVSRRAPFFIGQIRADICGTDPSKLRPADARLFHLALHFGEVFVKKNGVTGYQLRNNRSEDSQRPIQPWERAMRVNAGDTRSLNADMAPN